MNYPEISKISLYELVLNQFPALSEIHPLHKAMLEECCENVFAEIDKKKMEKIEDAIPLVDLVNSVNTGFLTSISLLKGLLKPFFKKENSVTLQYRNQEFILTPTDEFI